MKFKQTIDVDLDISIIACIYFKPRYSVDRKTAKLACSRDDMVSAVNFNMPRTSCG